MRKLTETRFLRVALAPGSLTTNNSRSPRVSDKGMLIMFLVDPQDTTHGLINDTFTAFSSAAKVMV